MTPAALMLAATSTAPTGISIHGHRLFPIHGTSLIHGGFAFRLFVAIPLMEQVKATSVLDGRTRAVENEIRVLRAIHRFGWLTARNLAALLWQPWSKAPPQAPSLRPTEVKASGLRMAQRTLVRLVLYGQVLRAPAPGGNVIYALAEAGARRLLGMGVPAATGKDLIRRFSSAHFQHRHIANVIAIRALVDGYRVSTEREIAQDKWMGGAEGIAGKKPDVLARAGKQMWWIEVEKSRKNAKDYAKLLVWLDRVRADTRNPDGAKLLDTSLTWGKVVFIGTAAFQAKLIRDLEARGWKRPEINAILHFDSALLYRAEDTFFV